MNGSLEKLTPLFTSVERTSLAKADDSFQRLCHEAVLACGADIAAVRRYVHERVAAMDEAARETIERDLERVLAYRAPCRPAAWLH